jgi:hypothetical protein
MQKGRRKTAFFFWPDRHARDIEALAEDWFGRRGGVHRPCVRQRTVSQFRNPDKG